MTGEQATGSTATALTSSATVYREMSDDELRRELRELEEFVSSGGVPCEGSMSRKEARRELEIVNREVERRAMEQR